MYIFFRLIISIWILIYSAHSFTWTKARIGDIHGSILSGEKTCRQIVQGYLDRILAYDQEIHSVITVNHNAIAEAILLDNQYKLTKKLVGIIHCAPLIVKDNIDVAGLPTTAGLNVFRYMVPDIDSDAVYNARQAGAIILGKANMSPLADKEAWGNSETGGLVRNPYNLNYTSYGSSGGNGAAGAAMFAVLGLGSETGVSVNLPSSAANLVGLRPPVELISRNGVLPNSDPQDVVGPMAKTVQDVALLLDALVGNINVPFYSSPSVLDKNGLKGAKINILKMFTYDTFSIPGVGTYNVAPQIVDLFNWMVQNMTAAGAVVKNQTLDTVGAMNATMQMFGANYESCMALWRDNYFGNVKRYGSSAPFHSVKDVVQENTMPMIYQNQWSHHLGVASDAMCTQQLTQYMSSRDAFIDKVLTPLLNGSDVAFWPAMPEFPPKLGDDAFRRDYGSSVQPPVNLILAGSWSGYPTIDVPIGFSKPTADEPNGLPVGAIFIAKPENLKVLLKVAYAYQQQFGTSKLPLSLPELNGKVEINASLTTPPPPTTTTTTTTTTTRAETTTNLMNLKGIKFSQFFTAFFDFVAK